MPREILCFLTVSIHRVSDAVQLHCASEDGSLAFYTGMDSYLLYFHIGNREDARGKTILDEPKTERKHKCFSFFLNLFNYFSLSIVLGRLTPKHLFSGKAEGMLEFQLLHFSILLF